MTPLQDSTPRLQRSIPKLQSMTPIHILYYTYSVTQYEPRHDKTNKVTVRPAKTPISLGGSAQSDQSLRCPHGESFGP